MPFEGLDQERWLKAAEFKPSYPLGKKVVHHHAVLIPENIALARYGVGKSWEMYPEGTGMRVPDKWSHRLESALFSRTKGLAMW